MDTLFRPNVFSNYGAAPLEKFGGYFHFPMSFYLAPLSFEAFGHFWVVRAQLGVGSSATVYHVNSGVDAAVKAFQLDTESGEYGFHKERQALEALQGHRNIVTLLGVFANAGTGRRPTPCLLLELLDVSVSELLVWSRHRGHSMWMIQHCARDMLKALAFLHHKNFVHADLKPRNILWSAQEECFKLIDFGLSFNEGNQDVKYVQTDGYRAPEAELQYFLAQLGADTGVECSSAIDLWSLGIVLLEMFSGYKLKDLTRSQEWKMNSSAIIDHIFASRVLDKPVFAMCHLRDLIKSMLYDNPGKRATAEEALCNPFFSIPFDVVNDMRMECRKYGSVVSLYIPKENPCKGQVFVEYASAADAKVARKTLAGKTFDGRIVVATYYPLSAYRRGHLYQTVL
ncbi:serine/threonine-protein kinase Kist isoform X2 [Protopterus annectens]|uniref:serine/threonine-protein kinase Kist isoform X2 n=1 Tax=Protopterus annectens TaxID=7888 RepID=UPI001CFBC144|nr:serine/threonine-protein kinase Kist isoform X2 [Protopterus annectens]